MKSLKTFQGFLWLLYQFLLILEVKCGTKREMFDCASIHVCDCGIADEYFKCFNLAPVKAKEVTQAWFDEFYPGEYNFKQGINPFNVKLFCNRTIIEHLFEIYLKLDSDMRIYLREIQSDPFRSKEQLQILDARERFKSLVYETPVNSAEDLVACIAATVGEVQYVSANVRSSIHWRCEFCIIARGRNFEYLL
ncbi:hypothetical protein TNIN_415041 [Trichonephila inaurata madagascariensis]|uniref:Uncharacterized protein n=1 Tax=Trichonephila inaurata madagascariensis TaxID=2747483 RepID=A0A8X6YKH9_9ARAC|nr:hypothetical protein TNIN_415041 [Trichonephila inaurata madagascariensis]